MGWPPPTGMPPTSTATDRRRSGCAWDIEPMVGRLGTRRAMRAGTVTTLLRSETMTDDGARPHRVWIVEDEPQASELALDLCTSNGAVGRVFRDPVEFIGALRAERGPSA